MSTDSRDPIRRLAQWAAEVNASRSRAADVVRRVRAATFLKELGGTRIT